MKNRRAMQRFTLNLISIVSLDSVIDDLKPYQYAVVENICAGGVYLKTSQPFTVDTKVFIDILLPVRPRTDPVRKIVSLIRVSGMVRRCESTGMAVEFDKGYSILPLLGAGVEL